MELLDQLAHRGKMVQMVSMGQPDQLVHKDNLAQMAQTAQMAQMDQPARLVLEDYLYIY